MQVLISSSRPCWAFTTKSGSAKKGRAIDTISASPLARISSATSGVLIRLVAISGVEICLRKRLVTSRKAARGTLVAMVGILASCQPIPVLIISIPASSRRLARVTTSFRASFFYEVQHRKAKNQNELATDPLPNTTDNLQRKFNSITVAATPSILPFVGSTHNKLIDQVSLRSHDLDTIVSSPLCEFRAPNKVPYGTFNKKARHRPWAKRRDRSFNRGGRNGEG